MASEKKLLRFATNNNANDVANNDSVNKACYSILVVDDDPAIHDVTRLVLQGFSCGGRKLDLHHVYSAAEAQQVLNAKSDFAVILLDVVMETDHAGLDLVNYIRKELSNQLSRIVLRTGQPGQAPELSVMVDYGINDYKAKTELTAAKLKACITAAVRTFDDITTVNNIAQQRMRFESRILAQNAQLKAINKQLQLEIIEVSNAGSEQATTHEKLESIIDNASAIISLKSLDGKYELVNRPFLDNLMVNCHSVAGKTDADLFPAETVEMLKFNDEQVLSTKQPIQCEEILPTLDGDHFYLCVKFPIYDATGEIYRIGSIAMDITERLQAQNKILNHSQYDSLTDLPNRTLLIDRLAQAISRTPWNHYFTAVLFIDLDRFKFINDTLGHDVGDKLLKAVSRRLKASVRDGDTVSRLGGDEFAIILTDLASDNDIRRVVKKISESLCETYLIEGKELITTPSIGISRCPVDGDDVQILLKKADVAMYKAKKAGRNTTCFYSVEDDARAIEQLNLEIEMRKMLDDMDGQLALVYQPKVNMNDGEIEGVEALLRWNHPEQGTISPGKFIPLMEETGLIDAVGDWVLQKACLFAARVNSPDSFVKVAINLSSRQFRQNGLLRKLVTILEQTSCRPQWIELEVTEGALLQDIDIARKILSEIARMGITLAIDDFGTGYSSMNYLKQLPFSTLKIDRCFIVDAPKEHQDKAIVTTIAQLAHNLDMSVVAEGVETSEQYQVLLEAMAKEDQNHIQGFIFSRPVEESKLPGLQKTIREKWQQVQTSAVA